MKTYTSPAFVEYGSVAELTRVAGGAFPNDRYQSYTGDVQTGNLGSVPSAFGCDDINQNDECDYDEGYTP